MAARPPPATVTAVQQDEQPGARSGQRPDWLVDLLAERSGPHAASTWAWQNRWLGLPTRFADVLDLAAQSALTDEELLQLTHASARRIHFAFALGTLEEFTREALLRFPTDELLGVLALAALVSDTADTDDAAWATLERCVREAPAEGISEHVLLTAVYLAAAVPRDVLERSLELANGLAARGDLIALYRTVSILRRLGRYEASMAAGMRVNDAIVSGTHPATLCEHLSERVLVERHLSVELLGRRYSAAPESQQERSDAGL